MLHGGRNIIWLSPSIVVYFLFLSVPFAHTSTFTAYGPRLFERSTGAPSPITSSFPISNPSTSYTLKIYNGGRADIRTGDRVSSAIITLNGAVIAGPQNFNEKVGEIDIPVKLLTSNTVSVELRSKPESLLVIEIVGDGNTAPSISFTAPTGLVVM